MFSTTTLAREATLRLGSDAAALVDSPQQSVSIVQGVVDKSVRTISLSNPLRSFHKNTPFDDSSDCSQRL